MSEYVPERDYVPSLELLDASADSVRFEVEKLMTAARDELCRIQDYDAELTDAMPGDLLAARTARHVSQHRLRAISRQFTIAHAHLVPNTDRERFAAAQSLLAWADDAQRRDPPYLVDVA